ncbi:hypothetical protein MMC17_001942 [Xylographa soralifera]|nr:hypothetical protein [Xylographa soralifera]
MSTFNGVVEEFPDIRIDYFRKVPDKASPLACFLSHVHSDHLQGLESLKSPFIYCSQGTRELLLRLEKFPHRMNFAKGILETRKVHYKHLERLLKTIPLSVPTDIELAPGRTIRVTLLDANHCAGAVMFLIDNATNAILYTGDIRAEPWWVNTIAREPVLIPYASGLRRLNKIYLDTTFATKDDPYRHFPTKAEGLQELLVKIDAYPSDTVFHFNAWTFGYEGVWSALAAALRSQIHVDQYKWGLYKALARFTSVPPQDGSALCGFQCGNRHQPGCLTTDDSVRLHSCDRGLECKHLISSPVVFITPIITRTVNGDVLPEGGAGGGGGDLVQSHEIDLQDPMAAIELMKLCSESIINADARMKTMRLITEAMASGSISVLLQNLDSTTDLVDMPLEQFTLLLRKIAETKDWSQSQQNNAVTTEKTQEVESRSQLAKYISFPYSRHSSYEELCQLVGTFRPTDIYPCTVDDKTWDHDVSVKVLFGHLCSGQIFAHDQSMVNVVEARERTTVVKQQALLDRPQPSSDPEESKYTATPVSIGLSSRVASNELSSPIPKKPKTASWNSIKAVMSHSRHPLTETNRSSATSGEKRVRAIKASFELETRRECGFRISKSQDTFTTERIESPSRRKNVQPHENVALQHGATFDQPVELSDESASSLSRSCEQAESLDISLEEIADIDCREQIRELQHKLGCSAIMARTFANIHCLQSVKDFFNQESEAAAYRSGFDSIPAVSTDRALVTKTILLRDLFPTADEHQCQRALIRRKGRLRDARDLLASWQESILKGIARSTFNGSGAEGDSSTESEQEDSQITLPDSAFESPQKHADDTEEVQVQDDNIINRKEAYKAALGKGGREWSTYSPITSSTATGTEDMELR